MRRFQDRNPITTAFYYLCVLTVTMFSMQPCLLCISLVSSVLTASLSRAVSRRAHRFSIGLFFVTALLDPIVVHNGVTVLFYVNDRPITAEATVYGVMAAVMIVAALYWLRSLSHTLSSDKVLYLFGRLSPKLSLLLSMSLRYIALFRMRWRRIMDTQRALGLYDDGNLIDAIRGRMRVLSILITWTLENGIVTAESMEARGYGAGRRSNFADERFHLSDGVIIALCAALTAVTLVGILHAQAVYYPKLHMDTGGVWGIAGAAAFAVLSLMPVILNTKEAIKWRCLLSKI